MGGKETSSTCFFLRDDYLIQEILVRLPIVSLLRFKSVAKSWRTLIESSFFTHLHHTNFSNNSSSSSSSSSSNNNNFGTFILQASVDKYDPGFHQLKVKTEIRILTSSSECGSSKSGWSGPRSGSDGWCWSTDDDDVFKVDDDDDHVFKVDDNLVLKLDRLGLPSCQKKNKKTHHHVVGSCNGLICLFDEEDSEVTLWNPATRQFRILPKPITTRYSYREIFVGFGFDIKAKDYKVVLFSFVRLSPGCHVQVYSLSTDSWRLLEEGINSLPGGGSGSGGGSGGGGLMHILHGLFMMPRLHGLYLNGSCFFVAMYRSGEHSGRSIMISFDFTKEIITTMEFPDHDRTQELFLTYLGGDKMALFTIGESPHKKYENYDPRYEDCDIWVLDEHGHGGGVNKESWTKLHLFQLKRSPVEWTVPNGISNNGKFALIESGVRCIDGFRNKMELYNLVTKEPKKDFLSYDKVMSRANVYKPSIVSIIGGNGAAATPADGVIGGAM